MDELEQLRAEIDEIDRKMTILFEERMKIVDKVGQYKQKNNLPILNTHREEMVLAKNGTYLQDKSLQEPLKKFFISLMKISKEKQNFS